MRINNKGLILIHNGTTSRFFCDFKFTVKPAKRGFELALARIGRAYFVPLISDKMSCISIISTPGRSFSTSRIPLPALSHLRALDTKLSCPRQSLFGRFQKNFHPPICVNNGHINYIKKCNVITFNTTKMTN